MEIQKSAGGDASGHRDWEPPTIRPLLRLGERIAPTTVSAGSPEHYASDLTDLQALFGELDPEAE